MFTLIVLSAKLNNLPFWKYEFSPERRCHGSVKMTVSERWVWFRLEWFTRPLQTTLMSRITISSNGRPCVTSQRQDRHLRLIHLRNRMITDEDTARRTPGLANIGMSGQTVRRRLCKSGIWARRLVVGPILKQHHRTVRLAWTRARRRWRLHTWQHILYSDESRFALRFIDGRYRVYRRCGEHFTDHCVYESDHFGCGSVMVWAGICHDGRSQLKIVQGTLNVVKYGDDILGHIVLSCLQQRNFGHVFQHDNARCHVVRVCQDFLNQNHIQVLLGGIITGSVINWTFMGWTR